MTPSPAPSPISPPESSPHLPEGFDWKEPDYTMVLRKRLEKLSLIRSTPGTVGALRQFYKANPAQFIIDWGVTLDPRNVERGLPSLVPFVLFPRQVEWINWTVDNWKNQRYGLTVKSRDSGLSWLSVALGCTLCLFYPGMNVGYGSRKEEYVDRLGSPKSLFFKARVFMQNIPPEFRGGWQSKVHGPFMRITFPGTDSVISGEAGDDIGRGDRQSIYFVDEASFLFRPELVDAALSQTTNCKQDISTPNGLGNPFAQRRFKPGTNVFTFSWRSDPRKGEEWYQKQKEDLSPVVLAQEVDLDFSASVEGVLIPSAWVQAAVDAHCKLGFQASGSKRGALDVADEGSDANAFLTAHGSVVTSITHWSGKNADIFHTVQRAFQLSDERDCESFKYDADGLGAGVRGDARVINDGRTTRKLVVNAFRGSAAVYRPESQDIKGRKNKDMFLNSKAQSWWALRVRFLNTYKAVCEGKEYVPDDIISLSSMIPGLEQLCTELSQPTYSVNAVGKYVIDKSPSGTKSPNLADACMILFSPVGQAMRISAEAISTAGLSGKFIRGRISKEALSI